MAGIYIHIPFCKQACYYCNFHFSTLQKKVSPFLQVLKKEIEVKKDYLSNERIKTIYFGGGTPSLLGAEQIQSIIHEVNKHFLVDKDAEITIEANPDDLTREKLLELKNTSINRLSIGVQSFFDDDLKYLNRAHQAKDAINAIQRSQDVGFENISIDLIYAIPTLSDEKWIKNIDLVLKSNIQHISAYCLTIEPKTALASFIKKKKAINVDEDKAIRQYEILIEKLTNNGFDHYEISNFAKEGFISKHNSSYWLQEKYLGLGPSAHSYNGENRHWNIANNSLYINNIINEKTFYEEEILSISTKYNDYVLTALRTMWGVDLNTVAKKYGQLYLEHLLQEVGKYLLNGWLTKKEGKLLLSNQGKMFADKITSDLLWVDNSSD